MFRGYYYLIYGRHILGGQELNIMSNTSSDLSATVLPLQGVNETPLMTVRDLAAYLKITPGTLYKMVERNEIPVIRLGGGRTVRFRRELIDEWLKEIRGK